MILYYKISQSASAQSTVRVSAQKEDSLWKKEA